MRWRGRAGDRTRRKLDVVELDPRLTNQTEDEPSQVCYVVIRPTTSYFLTDVRLPGVSPVGIAFSAASPVA